MGSCFSSLRSRCNSLWSKLWPRWFQRSPPHGPRAAGASDHGRLPDIEAGKGEEESKAPCPSTPPPTPKKRALLVGITYHDSTDPMWTPLDGPHVDVMHFQKLLIGAYFIRRSVVFFYGP